MLTWPEPYKIIQFWDTKAVPPDVARQVGEWARGVPDGHHLLFDDASAGEFISVNYPRYFRSAYDYCFHPAMKCDYFRLAYLYVNGGVYIDADDKMISALPIFDLLARDILIISPIIRRKLNGRAVGIKSGELSRGNLEAVNGPECYFANSPIFVSRRNEIVRVALIRATNAILAAKRDGTRCNIHQTTGPTNWTVAIVGTCLYAACGGTPLPKIKVIDWSRYAAQQQPLEYKSDNRYWVNFQNDAGIESSDAPD